MNGGPARSEYETSEQSFDSPSHVFGLLVAITVDIFLWGVDLPVPAGTGMLVGTVIVIVLNDNRIVFFSIPVSLLATLQLEGYMHCTHLSLLSSAVVDLRTLPSALFIL